MKLALIINSLGVGGAEKVMLNLAAYWVAQGHEVTIITFLAELNSYELLDQRINLICLQETKQRSGVNLNWHIFRFINRIYLVRKLLQTIKPDRIISFLFGGNITAIIASVFLKIPVIISERCDPNSYLIPKSYQWIRNFCYKYAAILVVQTNAIKAYFNKILSIKITVIPNYVKQPVNIKPKLYNANIKNIISVGRLDHYKDHKTLIYAMAELINIDQELTLHIYGDGILRVELAELIKKLKLEHCIFLPGIVNDLENKLLAADLFVFPSISEGFSNALCEAMSYQLPVIAADCPGNMNIIQDRDNGLLFKCGDVAALAKAVRELLHNRDLCNKLAVNASKVVDRFAAKQILAQWDQIIQVN